MNYSRRLGALNAVSVNVRHNVVANFFFARLGNVVIYIVRVRLKLCDLLVGNVEPELLFALGESYPEPPSRFELVIRREKVFHLFARIARIKGTFVNILHNNSHSLSICIYFDGFPKSPVADIIRRMAFGVLRNRAKLITSQNNF